MSHAFSGVWRTAAAVLLALLAGRGLAAGAELPFKPVPAYSPELQAQREGAVFRKEGDRLQEEGRSKEAKENWLAAVEAYQRAGYAIGEMEVLFKLGISYQSDMMSDPEAITKVLESMTRGTLVGARYLEDLARKDEPVDRTPYEEADTLLRRAAELAKVGNCGDALPLLEQAGQQYGARGLAVGELRALIGRLNCQPQGADLLKFMGFMPIMSEFQTVAQKLDGKVRGGPLVRYLRAVESIEFTRWQEAEKLLRELLAEFEATGQTAEVVKVLIDLGCVLVQTERLGEAETLFQRAQELLSDLKNHDSDRNRAALLQNLAGIEIASGRPGDAVPLFRQAQDLWRGVADTAREAEVLRILAGVLKNTGEDTQARAALSRAAELEARLGLKEESKIAGPSPPSPSDQTFSQESMSPRDSGSGIWRSPDLILDPQAQARREAAFLLGDGDRLQKAGNLKGAKENWLAAARLYRQAEDPSGVSDAYFRLSAAISGTVLSTGSLKEALRTYIEGLSAAAEAHETAYQEDESLDEEALASAGDLIRKAAPLRENGVCAQASSMLAQARSTYLRIGFVLGEVRTLMLEAECLTVSGDDDAAMRILLEALPKFGMIPENTRIGEMTTRADDLLRQSRLREAGEAFQDMLCQFERANNLKAVARTLVNEARLWLLLGEHSEAEKNLQRALGLLPFVDPKSGEETEARAHQRLGDTYFATGRLEDGMMEYRKALGFWRRSGQPSKERSTLVDLAMELVLSGEPVDAQAVLNDAEDLHRRLPLDPEAEGDLLMAKGMIYLIQGRLQDALGWAYRAEALYRQQGAVFKAEAALSLAAETPKFLGRSEEPSAILEKIKSVGGQSGSEFLKEWLKISTVLNLIENGKHEEAVDICRRLLPFWIQNGSPAGEGLFRAMLGFSYLNLGKLEEARLELDRAEQLIRDARAKGQGMEGQVLEFAQMFAAIGRILLQAQAMAANTGEGVNQGQHDELLNKLRRSLQEEIQAFGSPESTELFTEGTPKAFLEFVEKYLYEDPRGALLGFDNLLRKAERLGEGMTLSELKGPLSNRNFPLYSQGVELGFAAGQPQTAFRYAEEARARAFLDQIGNQKIGSRHGADPELIREERRLRVQRNRKREILRKEQVKSVIDQNGDLIGSLQRSLEQTEREYESLRFRLRATDSELASLVSVETLSLGEIQDELGQGETVVEFFLVAPNGITDSAGTVLAWVIEREQFVMEKLPVTEADLRTRVTELRNLIESRQPFQTQAAALYRDLFAPLIPHIRHRNVVIVPHGVLHFLPFAALWDEKGRRYLGDSYTLSFSPSATALKFARARKAVPAGPVLIAGNPDGSLPHAAEEARAIARLYGAEPLVGSAATEGIVAARAGEAGILHLAAHATLNPVNPLFTRIELAPDEGHDGSLEMHEVFGLDLSKTGLVVLSACSTQMGKLSAGDEIEGLTRAFLYAGTPAVMASLWNVDDESTSYLMARFYRHLRGGAGRAEALRRAQIETRRRFPHPYHWAAFVLTGNGGPNRSEPSGRR